VRVAIASNVGTNFVFKVGVIGNIVQQKMENRMNDQEFTLPNTAIYSGVGKLRIVRNTGKIYWKEIKDLSDPIFAEKQCPIFADIKGRHFLLCQETIDNFGELGFDPASIMD
jgi:hypothetical protein